MTVGFAITASDYVKYALAQRGRGARYLPVLDETNAHHWPRRIADRFGLDFTAVPPGREALDIDALRASADFAKGRAEHLVVLFGQEDEFCAPGLVFALAKNCRLTRASSADEVLKAAAEVPRGGYLTVVGSERSLDFHLLTRMWRETPWVTPGVLCAPTPAKLSELVFKTLLYPELPAERDEFYAGLLKGTEELRTGALTIFPADAVDADRLVGDLGMRRVLSFIAHASEDYLRISPGDILCGLTDDLAAREAAQAAAGPLPACLQGDTCVYPESRRHDPAELTGQVIFANACLSLKFGTQLLGEDNRFTISRRFLDGWAGTFVASPLLKDGIPAENLLFHTLLEGGATVGAAARAVNENLAWWGVDAPAVVVIGDPEAVYATAPVEPEEDSPPEVTSHGEVTDITFEGNVPARSRVRLAGAGLLQAYRDGTLEVSAAEPFGGRLPYYVAAAEREGALDLHLLGVQERVRREDEPPRRLQVTVRPAEDPLGWVVRAFARYENLAFMDLKLDKGRSVLADMVNNLPTMARRAKAVRYELTESERFDRSLRRIRDKCAQLDRGIMEKLLHATESREYHFVEAYRHTYTVQRTEAVTDPCRYCGEALHRYVSGNVLRPEMRRYLLSCPVCGAVQDTEDPDLTLTVHGDNRLRPGRETPLELEIVNSGTEEMRLLLGARITHGAPHGFEFRLGAASVTVPPGESSRTELVVRTATPRVRHSMLLRCYAVGEGRIQFAGRDLYIR